MSDNPETPIEFTSASAAVATDVPPAPTPSEAGWKRDKKGREYCGAIGRAGTVYRKADETVEEAQARDQEAREAGPKPKSRKSTASKRPAPTRPTSKELEAGLAEALEAPAMFAAMHGDTWVADHVCTQAPILARNLVSASDRNPRLRRALERVAGGDSALGEIVVMLALLNATAAYVLPIAIYYAGPRAPQRLRDAFQVPEKPKPEREAAMPRDPAFSEVPGEQFGVEGAGAEAA